MAEASIHNMALLALFNGRNVRALAEVAGLSVVQVMAGILSSQHELVALIKRAEAGAALSPRQRVRLELLQAAAREQDSLQGQAPASSLLQSPPSALLSQTGERAWRAGPSASTRPGPAA